CFLIGLSEVALPVLASHSRRFRLQSISVSNESRRCSIRPALRLALPETISAFGRHVFPKKSSAPRCFTGGGRLKRQRVDAALQFFLQQRVDGAVALDATHSGKGVSNDADAEMRFAGAVIDFMMTAILMVMAGVEVAFVNDFKALGNESRGQFRFHRALFAIVNGHLSHF